VQKAEILELIEVCEDLVKLASAQDAEIKHLRKAASMRAAIAPAITLEKVASAKIPQTTVYRFLDDLIVRGLIAPTDREKMATTLSDPEEMAKAAMQLAQQLVPGHASGVVIDPPSQFRQDDPKADTDALEKAAEDAEWREIARTGQC
jgi:hypothetical protein